MTNILEKTLIGIDRVLSTGTSVYINLIRFANMRNKFVISASGMVKQSFRNTFAKQRGF